MYERPGLIHGVRPGMLAPADPAAGTIAPGDEAEERTAGAAHYRLTLEVVHEALCPRLYLEIGVREGHSLRLARCRSIGIDPAIKLAEPLPDCSLYEMTSDDFFDAAAAAAIPAPIDLAFIDGLHLFEFALRDFMNIERHASPTGVILIDDVFPNHEAQASRHRRTRCWTGDVWRLMLCLSAYRPDLILLPLDCAPTGLLLIAGLDPANRVLSNRFNAIARQYLFESPRFPHSLISRGGAFPPGDRLVVGLLERLRRLRENSADGDSLARIHEDYRRYQGRALAS